MTLTYQYQSFDDTRGMVDSYAKLRAFHLPPLVGKSFFDVGCNEGYYCGVALRAGAKRVLGLDSFELAIERAKVRFPEAEFVRQTWDQLPDEQFDVVMFASAMHYLETEEKIVSLLSRIRNCLKPDGLLIIEAGVSLESGKRLVRVERPDGVAVCYPTWEKLVNLINSSGMAWRKIGESEPGDGHPRVVMHCRRVQPVVIFLRGGSMSGKSYLANSLSSYNYWRVLSVDEVLEQAFRAVVPGFDVDRSDWPSSLARATAEVPASFSEVAQFIVLEILKRHDLIATHNLPRQDPVIVDGFDPALPGYDQIFKSILNLLKRRNIRVWDTQLLSERVVDQWYAPDGYVDCGGFLLPLDVEGMNGSVKKLSIDHDCIKMKIEIESSNGSAARGLAISADGHGPIGNIELESSPARVGEIELAIPFSWFDSKMKKSFNGHEAELDISKLHFIVWTTAHTAFFLHKSN